MSGAALTRTNLLLETGKVRRLRKALQSSGLAEPAKARRSAGRLRTRPSEEEMISVSERPLL